MPYFVIDRYNKRTNCESLELAIKFAKEHPASHVFGCFGQFMASVSHDGRLTWANEHAVSFRCVGCGE
jgi:hypothetical protein